MPDHWHYSALEGKSVNLYADVVTSLVGQLLEIKKETKPTKCTDWFLKAGYLSLSTRTFAPTLTAFF